MKRSRSAANPVSLFPFLAVLVSAMGALILLLLVVARQAQRSRDIERAQANLTSSSYTVHPPLPSLPVHKQYEPVPPPIDAEPPPVALPPMPSVPTLMDRRDQLREKFREAFTAVQDQKRRLDEISNPRDSEEPRELANLSKAVADTQSKLRKAEEEARQIAEQRDQRVAERREIEEKLKRSKSAVVDNRFRIVPYFGANGTDRRPIYLECLSDRIVLMPEGVEIDAGLLADPSSPDNALARLVREMSDLCRSERSRPYPLLVVRPQGVAAYYVARMALATVEEEYGYELVDADVALDFGQANAKWREVAQASLAEQKRRGYIGRGRAFSLESTLPPGVPRSVLGGSPNDGLRGGISGGLKTPQERVATGGTNLAARLGAPVDKQRLEEAGRSLAPLAFDSAIGQDAVGLSDPLPEAVALAPGADSLTLGFEDPLLKGDDRESRASGGSRVGKEGGEGRRAPVGTSAASEEEEVPVVSRPLQAGSVALTPADGQRGSNPFVSPSSEFEQFLARNAQRRGKSPDDALVGAVDARESADSDLDGPGGSGGSAPPSLSSQQMQSVLEMVGPTVRTHSAVARRVVVEVREHGIVLHPGERYVSFDATMRSTKEAIYAHVAEQMASWGKPKRADRWTPIVELNVRPDGLERYYDLHFALAGSGLELERRLVGWKDSLEFRR